MQLVEPISTLIDSFSKFLSIYTSVRSIFFMQLHKVWIRGHKCRAYAEDLVSLRSNTYLLVSSSFCFNHFYYSCSLDSSSRV